MLFAVVDHSFDPATESTQRSHTFVNHPTICIIQFIWLRVSSQLVT